MRRLKPLDKAGREIKPGDPIVYGGSLGRSAVLQYGKILTIKFKPDREYNYSTKEREDVESPRYYIQGVWVWEGVANLNARGTLLFGDRILVLHRDQLPQIVLDALDAVIVPVPTQV
jgi:hypothetical protein